MDDGFKDRVDKVFASISSSSSSSSSSWSLSDSQVEKREWNRSNRDGDDDQIPSFLHHRHDWDIRSSIGLDSTLDNEEEEDAYDKMAQGQDNTGSLYIKDVHGLYLNSLPITKSILKRKTYDEVAKPAKRVSFHSTCKNAVSTPTPTPTPTPAPVSSGNGRAVPDYILNPSKYTRYSLDDCAPAPAPAHDGEEEASLEKSPKHHKSPVFIPRKKNAIIQEHKSSSIGVGIGIGVGIRFVDGDISEMQEDDVSTKARHVRQYRSSKIKEYHHHHHEDVVSED